MARGLRLRLKEEELRRLYQIEKRSLEDIARLYGTSRVAVWKYCGSLGLTRRSRSEARLEAQKGGKVPQDHFDINENFFSRWSPEMAYVLGLLITDGNVSNNGTISLCMNEKELIEKVAKTMGAEHKIAPSKHQKGLFIFHFARAGMVKDLGALCVVPRKSMIVKFPIVPEPFLTDFIRGVFDGDGSVYFNRHSKKHPVQTKFVSSSKEFIEKLESVLRKLGLPARTIYGQPTKNGITHMFRYGHKDSEKLFAVMYKDTGNSLFLARKYNKFLVGFNKDNKTQEVK